MNSFLSDQGWAVHRVKEQVPRPLSLDGSPDPSRPAWWCEFIDRYTQVVYTSRMEEHSLSFLGGGGVLEGSL